MPWLTYGFRLGSSPVAPAGSVMPLYTTCTSCCGLIAYAMALRKLTLFIGALVVFGSSHTVLAGSM